MAIGLVEQDTVGDTNSLFSLTLEQSTSPVSVVFAATGIALAAAILLTPFSLLLTQAALDPAAFAAAVRQPVIAVQLTLGFIVALTFVIVPLRHLLRRTMQPRRIIIADGSVRATSGFDDTATAWSEPLTAYRGVAHHIRTSLSGAQHEIVLVHPNAAKSVVLLAADRIGQHQVDAMASNLNVVEVPARTLYQRHAGAADLAGQAAAGVQLRAA